MRLRLVEKRKEAADVKTFLFAPDSDLFWRAGQYLFYKLPHANPDGRGPERYFSIASAPHEKRVMLTTRFSQNGSSFKKALDALPIGGFIEADPPAGDFLVDHVDKPLVFIAGGIGITAFRSILLDLDRRNERLNIRLLYANRNDELVFWNELESLRARKPDLKIDYFTGEKRLDGAEIKRLVKDLGAHRFYVSGPEPMVESLDRTLKDLGVPESQALNDFCPGYEWP
jgi:ferredoxin-NADP reductase